MLVYLFLLLSLATYASIFLSRQFLYLHIYVYIFYLSIPFLLFLSFLLPFSLSSPYYLPVGLSVHLNVTIYHLFLCLSSQQCSCLCSVTSTRRQPSISARTSPSTRLKWSPFMNRLKGSPFMNRLKGSPFMNRLECSHFIV